MDSAFGKIILTILACLLITHTIVSNLMVIIAFKINRQLHTLSNYCLVSLAVSDLIVGILLMSVFTLYLYIGYWPFGAFFCDLWLSLDYGVCTASILNLLVIAVDRLLSVSRPLTYRRTPTKMALMITAAWVVSGLIWAPWVFAWQYIDGVRIVPENECFVQVLVTNPIMATILSSCSFFIPVIVTTSLYVVLYMKTQQRKSRKKAMARSVSAKDGSVHDSRITSMETSVVSSFFQALCCCCFCNISDDDKPEKDGAAQQSTDSGIESHEKTDPKESPSIKSTDAKEVFSVTTHWQSNPELKSMPQTENNQVSNNVKSHDGETNGKAMESKSLKALADDPCSAGIDLENTTSLHEDLNSHGLEPEKAARIRTMNMKRHQQYNDRRMITILSATLLSLTISFAPYYTTAIVESFSPGFLNLVAANVCKYKYFTVNLCKTTTQNRRNNDLYDKW